MILKPPKLNRNPADIETNLRGNIPDGVVGPLVHGSDGADGNRPETAPRTFLEPPAISIEPPDKSQMKERCPTVFPSVYTTPWRPGNATEPIFHAQMAPRQPSSDTPIGQSGDGSGLPIS